MDKENRVFTEKEEIKLWLLKDLMTSEAEYCFDLGYNDDKNWRVNERVYGFANRLFDIARKSIPEILMEYDYDYFETCPYDLKR